MERPKRVLKPNKRYLLQAVDVLSKKVKKETKKASGTTKEKGQRLSKVNKRSNAKVVEVPEKKSSMETKTTGAIEENRSEESIPVTAPAEEEKSTKLNESAAKKIKSIIGVAGDLELAKSRNPADETRNKNKYSCKKHKRKTNKKYTIDCTDVEFINVHDVFNYMQSNIKIDGQKNNFGNQLKLCVDGNKMVFSGKTDVTIQYLKNLAKQFLQKKKLYCVRVMNKNPVLKYVHRD